MNFLYPAQNNPYYIYAPKYFHASAGVRVLYLLCHHLNLKGYQSYMVVGGGMKYRDSKVYDLMAPLLTKDIVNYHFQNQQCPIVLYSEVVIDNPLKAPLVVRYVLNYPGFLWGKKKFDKKEIIFAYTKKLADAITGRKVNIMYMPVCDTRIFYPPKKPVKRHGSCFNAYRHQEGGRELLDITKNSFEITRGLADSLNQFQVAELFRRSEIFYTYEDSSLAIEATLCGCPAVFIPNKLLSKGDQLAQNETGNYGMAFGIEKEKIEEAKKTVNLAFDNYIKSIGDFEESLNNFINITQTQAKKTSYNKPVRYGYLLIKILGNLELAKNYYLKYGLLKMLIKIVKIILYNINCGLNTK